MKANDGRKPALCRVMALLLKDLLGLRPNYFILNSRSVPSSSQCLDQVDGGDHLLAQELGGQSLVVE